MKAYVHDEYGSPDVLKIRELEKPVPAADEILVRVKATSMNPAEWYGMRGLIAARIVGGLFRPKDVRLGGDFSGVVEAVGAEVKDFKPGDAVFGGRHGAFAQYVTVKKNITHKPVNISFEEAAAVPVAGLSALQGLRDHGKLKAGQRVLITGAAGGVGSYAVQIAKAMGAYVAATCRTQNVDLVRGLGADAVYDYTKGEFPPIGQPFDLVLDIASTRPWSDFKRVMKPDALMVIVGGPGSKTFWGPLRRIAHLKLFSWRASQKTPFFVAQFKHEDFDTLAAMLASGKIRSVIDSTYPFSQLPAAMEKLGEAHAQGKIVVTVE